jgi:hypothetical protein
MTADADDLAMPGRRTRRFPDGAEHRPVVVAKFKDMVATQPISVEQLGRITASTLLVLMAIRVTFDHSESFRAIPNPSSLWSREPHTLS